MWIQIEIQSVSHMHLAFEHFKITDHVTLMNSLPTLDFDTS